ncbi:MAG: lactoylglutathione lyase [Leptospiraceae bacterium]|nr:lactoylglutathione lyase [Leptospiraceae bacterium]
MPERNTIGWFDIYVHDMDRAVAFYESVLEEKLQPLEDPTGSSQMMAFPGDQNSMQRYGALGALVKMDGVQPGAGGTLVYFQSADCSMEEARVVAAGGQVIRPKFSIGEFGWVTLCQDTEGNRFGFNSMT